LLITDQNTLWRSRKR